MFDGVMYCFIETEGERWRTDCAAGNAVDGSVNQRLGSTSVTDGDNYRPKPYTHTQTHTHTLPLACSSILERRCRPHTSLKEVPSNFSRGFLTYLGTDAFRRQWAGKNFDTFAFLYILFTKCIKILCTAPSLTRG